jgi:hypothetical protein
VADQRVVVGLSDRIADRLRLELLRALEHIDRDFQIGVLEADRLRPLLAGCRLIGVAELLCRFAREPRFERMMMRPPHFGRHAHAAVAERLDRGREQKRLERRDDLRPVILLGALRPEDRELRRVEDAADDVAVGLFQLGNLGGEVV